MRAGFLQFTPASCDPGANLAHLAQALRGLAADLVVLPELCTTGYQLTRAEALALAEPFPGGPTCAALERIAREQDLFLVAGVAEREGARAFNACVLVGPEGHLATYRKIHLFAFEREAFDPGDRAFFATGIRGGRVGMMICFDWAFPESARSLALEGAELIAHPANLVLPYCQKAMGVRCLENGVFAITCNRGGSEDRIPGQPALRFTGNSLIAGPRGELLAEAQGDAECLRVAEIDLARARDKRLTPQNDRLADRRPELYRSR